MLRSGLQYLNERRYDLVYARRRRNYVPSLPPLDAKDQAIVDALVHEGAYATTLDDLGIPGSEQLLADADDLFCHVAPSASDQDIYVAKPPTAELERRPQIIKWGLEQRLLAIATNYIGLPVSYRGLAPRLDLANGKAVGTRLWHRDNEDNRILKIIVYLNDVDELGGPFEYIPVYHSPSAWRTKLVGGRLDDVAMEALTPRQKWVACTGRRATVLFADPCRFFHRGRPPVARSRYALFYAYNSQSPMNAQWCSPLFDAKAFSAAHDLAPQQRHALTYPY